MDIAGHNLQRELNDVNNLWKWPTATWTAGNKTKASKFIPQLTTWLNTAIGGSAGIIAGGVSSDILKFTSSSFVATTPNSYSAGLFLDISDDSSYVMEFDAQFETDSTFSASIRAIPYLKTENGMVICAYGIGGMTEQAMNFTTSGYHTYKFFMPKDYVPLMAFFCSTGWLTFTNIALREGVD